MILILGMLNYGSVLIFGMVLAFVFIGKKYTPQVILPMVLLFVFLAGLQAGSYLLFGTEITAELYPLITHLPLTLFFCLWGKKSFGRSLVAVLMAYLCCQPRRWFGSLVSACFGQNQVLYHLSQILVTIPLLIYLIKIVSPAMVRIMDASPRSLLLFGSVPVMFYAFDYIATVYTDSLYQGAKVVVEFTPSVLCIFYLLVIIFFSREEERRNRLAFDQNILNLQVHQSVKELEALRKSQSAAATYRHDLRHHLQFINSCIENGRLREAQDYIYDFLKRADEQKIITYCKNESVNLILSTYAARAKELHIETEFQVSLPSDLSLSPYDLCVILSNSLENAINACKNLGFNSQRIIQVHAYQKGERTFVQVRNPYIGQIEFKDALPVSMELGHGIGTRSIVMTLERYAGLYSFEAADGWFTFRFSV